MYLQLNTGKTGYKVQVYQDIGLQVPSCCVRKEEEKENKNKGREASIIYTFPCYATIQDD